MNAPQPGEGSRHASSASLVQTLLGAEWDLLPPALQAHHKGGHSRETGHLDIEFPGWMQPILFCLVAMGALLGRRGKGVATAVEKVTQGDRQVWHRRIQYPDGQLALFDSVWVASGKGQLIEYVNSVLGAKLMLSVVGDQLHYRGLGYVVKLGRLHLHLPEWLALGHVEIREYALDPHRFAMDFWLLHPLFGRVYRYAGVFEVSDQAGV
jgi:hypothetical protein